MSVSPFVRQLRRPASVTIALLCVLAVCSSASDASGYGGAGPASPVRSATTPLSSYQSGTIGRPNPLNSGGNRVVTGNVGAGKHFRGPVPYRSTTSLSAPLGSTSLDSFMRYTAPPVTPRSGAGTYGSFYSRTGTVTSTLPGTRYVSTPGVLRVGSGAVPRQGVNSGDALYSDLPSSSSWSPDAGSLSGGATLDATPRLKLWPGSTPDPAGERTLKGFGEPLADGYLSPPRTETVTGGDYKQQMEALQQRLGAVQSELSALEQSLAARDNSSQLPGETDKVSGTFFQQLPGPDITASEKKTPNALEPRPSQSRKDELLQETARLLSATTGLPASDAVQDSALSWGASPDSASMMSTDTETRLRLYRPATGTEVSGTFSPQTVGSEFTDRRETVTDTLGVATEAVGVAHPVAERTVVQPSVQGPAWKLDTKKAASSRKAFERHLQAARQYARQGRYLQAADAFTLASAYGPNDSQSYLGKSHALLAAGEYIGSALALAKAVELDPQFALRKLDLVWIAGGPDAFIGRFNALDEAIQADVTPHLQFLLAYIYHQMDRPQAARAAIDAARRALPSSISIGLLKAAIDR